MPIVDQEVLVKQRVLLAVVQFQPPLCLAIQDRLAGLCDESLATDWQILLQVVVQRDAVIGVFEQLQFELQVLELKLLFRPQECLVVCLQHLYLLNLLLVLTDVSLCYVCPTLKLFKKISVVLKPLEVLLSHLVEAAAARGELLRMVVD